MATPSELTALWNISQDLAKLTASIKATNASVDAFFLCTMAIVIYFMQCGFAFLEAGAVRSKHTTNILIKNILDSFLGCIAYYVFGWALAFGEPGNAFCGNSFWAMAQLPDSRMHMWFFQFVFSATSATIVSGALAERCEFTAYMVYSFVISGFVYPIVSHWAWSPVGWLAVGLTAQNGTLVSHYKDFAGSGVVHITGGTAALVAAALLGPRINRFDPETGEPRSIPGHSVPLVSLGGFILFFGFLAFNGGSQLHIQQPNDGDNVAIAMVNTVLSCSTAAFTTLLLTRIRGPHWSLLRMVNGGLAGMVAICAGCNVVYPWGACVMGFIASGSYMAWSELVLKMRVDDPVEAIAVHYGGGIWGVIGVAFLRRDRGILFYWNQQSGLDLAMQIVGALSITAWSGCAALVVFGTMRLLKVLRVSTEMEIKGLDYPKHGEMAYPLTAYGHGWKDDNAVPELGATEMLPELVMNPYSHSHYKFDAQPVNEAMKSAGSNSQTQRDLQANSGIINPALVDF